MIVTRTDARRIISNAYGPEFNFRISTKCTLGVRPVYDHRPTLAWRSLDAGRDSAVSIGRLMPNLDIDWSCS